MSDGGIFWQQRMSSICLLFHFSSSRAIERRHLRRGDLFFDYLILESIGITLRIPVGNYENNNDDNNNNYHSSICFTDRSVRGFLGQSRQRFPPPPSPPQLAVVTSHFHVLFLHHQLSLPSHAVDAIQSECFLDAAPHFRRDEYYLHHHRQK